MNTLLADWLHAAKQGSSYRHMYGLACTFLAIPGVSDSSIKLAACVCRNLFPVVNDPIAPSDVLKIANSAFKELLEMAANEHAGSDHSKIEHPLHSSVRRVA